jgi:carboxylate-amine ligase
VTALAGQALEHRFGRTPGFPLGVEHELLLIEPATGRLAADAPEVIATAVCPTGRLASEIFATEVELVTPVCRTIDEAARSLAELLAAVRATGHAVLGAGLHPGAADGDAALTCSRRYAQVGDSLQGLLRNPPAALHVHVGMPDPETAIRVANGMRRHLPLLHSLAANSPFWHGQDSGLASARAAILRSYPRYGVPRWFRDFEDFVRTTEELAEAAGVPDYTYVWWDVRPHPRFGTVEVRAPDAQFSLERALALAAFIHALARMEADAPPPAYQSRETIEEGCYQATRYGLDALLVGPEGGRLPARYLAREMMLRVAPYARELGCADAVADLDGVLRDGNGADVQRRVHRREGLDGLVRWLIACGGDHCP